MFPEGATERRERERERERKSTERKRERERERKRENNHPSASGILVERCMNVCIHRRRLAFSVCCGFHFPTKEGVEMAKGFLGTPRGSKALKKTKEAMGKKKVAKKKEIERHRAASAKNRSHKYIG